MELMRRSLIVFVIVGALFMVANFQNIVYALDVTKENTLRMRVVANSNSFSDQLIKRAVSREIQEYIFPMVDDTISTREAAEQLLEDNKEKIEELIESTLDALNASYDYEIRFGNNYFPRTSKSNMEFEEGEYKSFVVVLGNGRGSNWWCIMFPPLCLMEARDNETKNVEYRLFITELLKRWLG